jgi:Glycosidases
MKKKTTALLLAICILTIAITSCTQTKPEKKVYDDNYRNFYEIYVRSFSDSNGDGIGDLRGVLSKLDYLKAADGADDSHSLGIDGVWFMPIFPSPSDHKYDVTDYYSIDPAYGTMEDFDELLEKFHERGIHLILDLVLNHTSQLHPWFLQAVEAINSGDLENKYVKYYNFTSQPEETDEEGNVVGFNVVPGNEDGWYYESRFSPDMPDLNLDNPDVWDEIKSIMKFWLDKGVDGFRLDACKSYYTDSMEDSIQALAKIVDYGKSVRPDCYFVAEIWDGEWMISQYYESGVDSVFNFDCSYTGPYSGLFNNIKTGNGKKVGHRLEDFNTAIRNKNIHAIDAPFLSNHDTPRSGTYFKSSVNKKLAASLYMMLPGNPFIYYGEEIGMTEGWANDSDKRLPIKWSIEESGARINPPKGANYVSPPQYGVFQQLEHETSLVNHYRKLIRLRNQNPEIARAQVVSAADLQYNVASYTCAYEDSAVMVVTNLTATPKTVNVREAGYETFTEVNGFVIADDYIEQEQFRAYMNNDEYEVPELRPHAVPMVYVDGELTLPPRATVVLRSTAKASSTFVTTTTVPPEVTPSDMVTPSDAPPEDS